MIGASEDAHHFSYEVTMLMSMLNGLSNLPIGTPTELWNTASRNSVIENFAIHARVLIAFFWPAAPRADNIVFSDFEDPLVDFSDPRIDRLLNLTPEIDKRMAHLTRHRNADFSGWIPLLITGDLMENVDQFLRQIKYEHPVVTSWFDWADRATTNYKLDYRTQYRLLRQVSGKY
jgi:hypothetical protein